MTKCISTDPEWAEFAQKRRQKREELNRPWENKAADYLPCAKTGSVYDGCACEGDCIYKGQ